jgi:hypothetical protein
MYSEARKIHVIEEVLKVQSEAVLIEIESILKRKGAHSKTAKAHSKTTKNEVKPKPSDYAGCITKETAKELLQQVEQSRNEWERDI